MVKSIKVENSQWEDLQKIKLELKLSSISEVIQKNYDIIKFINENRVKLQEIQEKSKSADMQQTIIFCLKEYLSLVEYEQEKQKILNKQEVKDGL